LLQLLREDTRYKPEAYEFVRVALSYAQNVLQMGAPSPTDIEEQQIEEQQIEEQPQVEPHLTGQQLCEAIRLYAIEQYGYMAKVVLNNWGLHTTSDFGEIVYNLIRIGEMKKSKSDRREDFNDVYDFNEAFQRCFEITMPE
jgi:uncharacterized repeat protein (TIGR04138 family)